jgi:hypothetical protein
MADKVSIYNMALRMIGESPVQSPTEDSENAASINDIYDITRLALLRQVPWNFAMKTGELAEITSETPPDFEKVYQLPSDIVKLIEIVNSLTQEQTTYYEIRGSKLYCDLSSVCIKYVYDITDTAAFDSLFTIAMAYAIAVQICIARTGDVALQQNLANAYIATLSQARGESSGENRKEYAIGTKFVNAR